MVQGRWHPHYACDVYSDSTSLLNCSSVFYNLASFSFKSLEFSVEMTAVDVWEHELYLMF